MFNHLFSKGGLSLERMRGFMQMAEAGSISRAAPGDANRQSQISRQIRELEHFFGTKLTKRNGRMLTLSPAGQRLSQLIRGQLHDLEDFRKEQAEQPKSLVIGAAASVLDWLLVPVLPAISTLLGNATLYTEVHRSRSLSDAVRDGRVDLALIRKSAVAKGDPMAAVMKVGFHLCIPRRLLKRGTSQQDASSPLVWQRLPFAAGRDGGEADAAIRNSMKGVGVDFRPKFECGSLLQVLKLVQLEACAAILPTVGIPSLDPKLVLVLPFTPMRTFDRTLVLHWNRRQMERRGIESGHLKRLARLIATQRLP
ncbi:MAG: LysR family transcriptional regulator [Verrucomicrobiaceae bacterium]|nr:LysR family transcriptional regulator [Verrucomicrobiaceae bacterium]